VSSTVYDHTSIRKPVDQLEPAGAVVSGRQHWTVSTCDDRRSSTHVRSHLRRRDRHRHLPAGRSDRAGAVARSVSLPAMHIVAAAHHAYHMTFLQAVVIGLVQGFSELFPISSLGHSVLVPALIGGSWKTLVTQQSQGESPYLAFIVGLHVATALALLVFFWRDWVAIIAGFFRSFARRRIETVHERLAWLLVLATIPAGITGLLLEHEFRVLFAKPVAAAAFLTANGVILFVGERLRRRDVVRATEERERRARESARPAREGATRTDLELDAGITRRVGWFSAFVIGAFQVLALLAGISRSGITMVAGLLRGLDHEQALRFAFLLATPIILAAGVLKIPDLLGHLGNGIRGQVLAGSGAAFVMALLSAGFLVRWFRTRTLTPFAGYCLAFGVACLLYFR
jgi:undecaprenyl-diphosphatase